MQGIISQIQQDILNSATPLNAIMLKAKVLAYKLGNDEFKQWAKNELDGYENSKDLPDYRIIQAQLFGTFSNGFKLYSNVPTPVSSLPEQLQELMGVIRIFDGIRSLQNMAENDKNLKFHVPADLVQVFNAYNSNQMPCLEIAMPAGSHIFVQILDTIRSRLQDFILEISDLPWDMKNGALSESQIQHLVNVSIFNNPQGGNMPVFDQRNQTVNYQYNAAGDINIDAVESKTDLMAELEKLKVEIAKASQAEVLNEDTVVDTEYQITKAIQEIKKPKPDKKSFLDHIGKAKALLEDIQAATGLVTALLKATDIAKDLF